MNNSTPWQTKVPSNVKKLIADASVEFAFLDNRPFETVKGDGFVNLIKNILAAGQQLPELTGEQVKELLHDPTTVCENHIFEIVHHSVYALD